MFKGFSSRSSRSSQSEDTDDGGASIASGFMAGAAAVAGRLRRMTGSASTPAITPALPLQSMKYVASKSPSLSPEPSPGRDRDNTSSGAALASPGPRSFGGGLGARSTPDLRAVKSSMLTTPESSPGTTPRTPRSVEVSVEGQQASMPPGVWETEDHMDVLADQSECTVTVKTGLTGRNGMHVVLRVGLFAVETGRRLAVTSESLQDGTSLQVSGAEQCDIGRLPNKNSGGSPRIPEPGYCQHEWSGWLGEDGIGLQQQEEISMQEALALGPASCCVEFRCKLSLQVHALCVLRDGGQAALRVEVHGVLSLQPWFRLKGEAAFQALYKSARELFAKGQDIKALQKCEEALTIADGLSPRPAEIGDALHLLGALHLRRKTPAVAVKCLERALVIRKMMAPTKEVAILSTLFALGSAYVQTGSLSEASRCLQLAVAGFEQCSQEMAALASALHALAGVHRMLGEHEQALHCYERCLAVREEVLGADHLTLVATLNNLGAAAQHLSRHREAVRYYHRALVLETKHYGKEHFTAAATLGNLGAAHGQLKEHKCAVDCLARALQIQEKHFGREHLSVATTLHNLGNSLAAAGHGHDAIKCHWRALNIWHKLLGPCNADIAATLHSLGNVYRGLLDPASAAKCFEGALHIREVVLGPTHPETARTRHCSALVGCSLGEPRTALQELEVAVKSLMSGLGALHPWTQQASVDTEALRAAVLGA
eukprot:TRINITY_DN9190_c0_g1_i1.p1 TRINITY_DN9190_c0_g1~~TRINITY_DN9190_c0_g1_i1.p1  ORF type:complete len:715 (-),score=120.22 TRINITY_DN9190_c0_g1_i1:406-2550(-)